MEETSMGNKSMSFLCGVSIGIFILMLENGDLSIKIVT